MLVAEFKSEIVDFVTRHGLTDREASGIMGMASNYVCRVRQGRVCNAATIDHVRQNMCTYDAGFRRLSA